jgi:hypothetical protein
MSKSSYVLLPALIIIVLLSAVVHAGYLDVTKTVGTGGTTFTLQWFQGCGSDTRVEYHNGVFFRNMNLMLGPNSCNSGSATLGNHRAVLCLIGSDAG